MTHCFSFYSEGMHQLIITAAAGLGLELWVGDVIEETFPPIDGRWDPRKGKVEGAAPDEVASLVTYIASPLASATTDAALRVDGGVIKSAF